MKILRQNVREKGRWRATARAVTAVKQKPRLTPAVRAGGRRGCRSDPRWCWMVEVVPVCLVGTSDLHRSPPVCRRSGAKAAPVPLGRIVNTIFAEMEEGKTRGRAL